MLSLNDLEKFDLIVDRLNEYNLISVSTKDKLKQIYYDQMKFINQIPPEVN
jgi:hypothetical protein